MQLLTTGEVEPAQPMQQQPLAEPVQQPAAASGSGPQVLADGSILFPDGRLILADCSRQIMPDGQVVELVTAPRVQQQPACAASSSPVAQVWQQRQQNSSGGRRRGLLRFIQDTVTACGGDETEALRMWSEVHATCSPQLTALQMGDGLRLLVGLVDSLRTVPKELPYFAEGRRTRFDTGSMTVEQLLVVVCRVLGEQLASQVLGDFTTEQLLAEADRLQKRPWVQQ